MNKDLKLFIKVTAEILKNDVELCESILRTHEDEKAKDQMLFLFDGIIESCKNGKRLLLERENVCS